MTPTQQSQIEYEAEELYPIVPDPAMPDIIKDRYEPLRLSWIAGRSKTIEEVENWKERCEMAEAVIEASRQPDFKIYTDTINKWAKKYNLEKYKK